MAIRSTNVSWLGWFALLPLFFAIRMWRPAAALLGGALWGSTLWLCLSTGSGEAIEQAPASLALLIIVPALYACLGSWVTRWSAYSPLVLGVGWLAVELALHPLGLRHGLLATTQDGSGWATYLAPLLGYAMVSFLVALVTASFVSALSAVRLPVRRPARCSESDDTGTPVTPQVFAFFL